MPILMKIIGRIDRENHKAFFDKLLPHLYRSMHETRPTGIEVHFPSLQRYMNKKDNSPRFAHEFFAVRKFIYDQHFKHTRIRTFPPLSHFRTAYKSIDRH